MKGHVLGTSYGGGHPERGAVGFFNETQVGGDKYAVGRIEPGRSESSLVCGRTGTGTGTGLCCEGKVYYVPFGLDTIEKFRVMKF
jgi:hypothetical protein